MGLGEQHVQREGGVPAGAPVGWVRQAGVVGMRQEGRDVLWAYAVPAGLVDDQPGPGCTD